MKIVYFDLETTGLEEDNSIIEIAAEYYKDGQKVSGYSAKCFDRDAVVDLNALQVNKTPFKKLRDKQSEKDGLMGLFDWLLEIKDTDVELSGINVQFDFNFTKNRAKKYNIKIGSVLPYRMTDLGEIARFLTKMGLLKIEKSGRGNTLKDLAKALNIECDETTLHSAEGDVALYSKVHQAMLDLAKNAICTCRTKV